MDWLTILLSGISPLLTGVLLYQFQERSKAETKERNESKKKQLALMDCVTALARDRLIQSMDYYNALGWVPEHKAAVVSKLYTAYHNLGGNDVVTETYHSFLTLPHSSPREEESVNVRI